MSTINYSMATCTRYKKGFENNRMYILISIPVLVNDKNEVVNNDLDKAKLLNSFFSSQSIIDDSNKEVPELENKRRTCT